MNAGKAVLVTGASSGIGHATCVAFLARGYEVYGTARRAEDAERLRREWGSAFEPLTLDLAEPASVEAGVKRLFELRAGRGLDGLVNNAGIALPGPLAEQPFEQIRAMFEVNFFGLLELTRACLPLLGLREPHDRAPGRIVNISSGAGQLAVPFLAGYVASKHALEGVSNALRRELLPWNIAVVVVGPGNVRTPIWTKAPSADSYDGGRFGRTFRNFIEFMLAGEKQGMQPEEIAAVVVRAVEAKNPETRYAPVAQKFANWTLPRLLPAKLVDRMLFKALGMSQSAPGGQLPAPMPAP